MISSPVNAGSLIAVVLISSVVAVTTLTTLVASASAGSVVSSAAAAAKIFLVLPSSATSWELITFKILVAVLDEGSIAEFKLSSGDVVQFRTDGVIMHQFFVPIAVSQFHVISNGMGKACLFIRVLLLQCFLNYHFQVAAKVCIPGMAFGIRKRVGLLMISFAGGFGIRTINIECKITDEKKVIPQFMAVVFYCLQLWIQESHQFDDILCLLLSFFAVFNGQQEFNHFLNMAAVFF